MLSELLSSAVVVSDLPDPLFKSKGVQVQLLRLDQIDPVLSGNKPFKLIPNLQRARAEGFDTVLSFGGAYSNHIHALAEAGQRFGFNTIAVIRGDDGQPDSHTLTFARARGMKLLRVSRQQYRRRDEPLFIEQLHAEHGDFYLIPEGGANQVGVEGCMQLATLIRGLEQPPYHEIVLACGTGSTLAGLVAGLRAETFVRGIAVLKGAEFLRADVAAWLTQLTAPGSIRASAWAVETVYHWGGYGRYPAPLAEFIRQQEQQSAVLFDPVYTAKLISAVYQRVAADCYAPGTRLLVLHTGGLQGRHPS